MTAVAIFGLKMSYCLYAFYDGFSMQLRSVTEQSVTDITIVPSTLSITRKQLTFKNVFVIEMNECS